MSYFNNLQNKKCWGSEFEEMDFTKPVTWNNSTQNDEYTRKIQIDKKTDNLVIKLSKFPLEFIPESQTKRLRIFIEISYN